MPVKKQTYTKIHVVTGYHNISKRDKNFIVSWEEKRKAFGGKSGGQTRHHPFLFVITVKSYMYFQSTTGLYSLLYFCIHKQSKCTRLVINFILSKDNKFYYTKSHLAQDHTHTCFEKGANISGKLHCSG